MTADSMLKMEKSAEKMQQRPENKVPAKKTASRVTESMTETTSLSTATFGSSSFFFSSKRRKIRRPGFSWVPTHDFHLLFRKKGV
jgi:hypothetical protein